MGATRARALIQGLLGQSLAGDVAQLGSCSFFQRRSVVHRHDAGLGAVVSWVYGKETADTSKSSEVMGLSTENMAQVDELADKLCKPGAQALGRTAG
jgi:hypothetical protein